MLEWLIVGGGIHGTHLALVLIQGAGVEHERIRVVDPHAEPLARWHACTANTGMAFLRSAAVHHIDLHSDALTQFAKAPAGKPFARFVEPYRRPSVDLFRAHALDVIERSGVQQCWTTDRVCGIQRINGGWQVASTAGSMEARQVVLAMGAGEQPAWPLWAQSLGMMDAPIHHVFAPALPHQSRPVASCRCCWWRYFGSPNRIGISRTATAKRDTADAPCPTQASTRQ
ncbi:MAG: FAD/NAD(P)-binding protein [Chloroflexaceae bacterium]|nr:FAD/NAD(P)-binding protein [Chloroflexaceae bacterium]